MKLNYSVSETSESTNQMSLSNVHLNAQLFQNRTDFTTRTELAALYNNSRSADEAQTWLSTVL